MTWQPIETAPMNGAPVLVYVPQGRFTWEEAETLVAEFDRRWRVCGADGREMDTTLDDRDPTHWQPLPAPPEAEDE